MFGNAGAQPPTDANGRDSSSEASSSVPPGLACPAESSISLVNDNSVGNWLEDLPERSWDVGPGE
ncbi:hypothetical protein [Cryobacterium sp. TMT2-42-4]|uniref:hypothetical protein n=1 Tax=Cryobacterium sp. TMT2-42-4 TaxID=1259255 RepID=UPI00106B02DC|nr:hypothetical protein [Cryobacterium sp. TMT2-42-4]TFC36204.1 hypothetical protein E3O18_08095 [Cryobacterium sp. TMT2-42-4]